jgi:hypothetical protein
METNLTAHYLAIETERARLPMQAERGWLIEQAATTQQGHVGSTALRRWIGGVMVMIGTRMRGMPEAAILTKEPKHAQ